MESERYLCLKNLIKKTVVFKCRFSKYGHTFGTYSKNTCLMNIKSIEYAGVVIDHLWVNSAELVKARLKTNQTILIRAKVSQRKRPGESVFDECVKDIKFEEVSILKSRRRDDAIFV